MKPVGYAKLRAEYSIQAIPHFRSTYIVPKARPSVLKEAGHEEHHLPSVYDPGDGFGNQIEFALKHEGLDLALLSGLFEVVPVRDVVSAILAKPTGQYRRKLWFLYEMLTGRALPLSDMTSGTYVPLADEDIYFTSATPRRSSRHRINDNLLGDKHFCPLIRKTPLLETMRERQFDGAARKALAEFPPELQARAGMYLLNKETKSTFLIELEEVGARQNARFGAMLRDAERRDFANEASLIELQNAIVEPRFAEKGFRRGEAYVGESRSFDDEIVRYVCPKAADVPSLLNGLLDSHRQMEASELDPVLRAAVLSFGFAFIRPFEDGNGRIHRFLIQNVLSRAGYSGSNGPFPISAAVLRRQRDYDEAFAAFAAPLSGIIDWSLDKSGSISVHGDTARHYRYLDYTTFCERLYGFIEQAVEVEIPEELDFLEKFEAARSAVRSVVDMPDKLIDIFVLTSANRGKLSASQRKDTFGSLSDSEIHEMEKRIKAAVNSLPSRASRNRLREIA